MKKTNFVFLREFAKSHYKSGDITLAEYIQIVSICDKADERMLLESEE